ncbi:radical SAM protein [Cysteiniphilum litorale]|uniref:Radical SAM protein n=2 Tax=Cysteiniphilum TaxID=2056696 RepID=A0A8J2Z387_9GAMM|nr:radical SAM protein [Cysteiniphilum litorale]GGF92639.1 radical SAM protein [Cysteiniphilum litorale]
MDIFVVIAKPTKACNADCSYCSAIPYDKEKWTVEKFMHIWDTLKPGLNQQVQWIWHGGEPLLMSPEFYTSCYEYAKLTHPNVRFEMQSNITLYKSSRWKDTIEKVFNGCVSTSFEYGGMRTIFGDAAKFEKVFKWKLKIIIDDGFSTGIIGTYSDRNIDQAVKMYDLAISHDIKAPSIRINYMRPQGRVKDHGVLMSEHKYTQTLLALWDRWVNDAPAFDVIPLADFLYSVLGVHKSYKCPYTRSCGGRFLSVEPNGDLYNCAVSSDTRNKDFSFGNVFDLIVDNKRVPQDAFIQHLNEAQALRVIKSRRYQVHLDCVKCPHFRECQGGCPSDSMLFDGSISSKFYYCETWKALLTKVKEDLAQGKLDRLLKKRGLSPTRYAPGSRALAFV